MNREEANMIGFEIVAYAGEARSKLLDALKLAKTGEFSKAETLIEESGKSLAEAHKAQTQMLANEASGDNVEVGFIMVHGQDHLMTALLLKDVIGHLVELYKRG
ncbi:PTS system lactose-specific IIA component, Lac family [Carnobacterium iners]|uniref:PTS system lactose-specific EIIA component n=1 Tax=Carnobacterium iners TaxID=1073423 RepID=A0A1X7N1D5_9LACT|nr:lactose-specific PTS transporter subunit IIA [Carnobacterium iners]SEK20124.1 PTS system lactose-specific IIA component, Lac family [Carnobacterium iners]SMH30155.1 PTS system lactose-specific IIA component, Lac family [Carnobacterium iners]